MENSKSTMDLKSIAEGLSGIPPLHVVMASPEIAPFAKTGGLGDVLASLPRALERLGLRISLIMPAYHSVLQGGFQLDDAGLGFTVPISNSREAGTLLKTKMGRDITVYLIRADQYYDREHFYGTHGEDYLDNAERFTFFARSILGVLKQDPPAILHAHDWQSALAVAFLKAQPHLYPELSSMKTVFTVHNLGYQGLFSYLDWHLLNLEGHFFTPRYLEFWGKINFLKGGLVFADKITTVSPAYARRSRLSIKGLGWTGSSESGHRTWLVFLTGPIMKSGILKPIRSSPVHMVPIIFGGRSLASPICKGFSAFTVIPIFLSLEWSRA